MALCDRKCGHQSCLKCGPHIRAFSRKYPIRQRIIDAIRDHGVGGRIEYWKLAQIVFPREHMPNAWRYSSNGGPPGCYMVLSSALRRHEFRVSHRMGASGYAIVGYGKNRPEEVSK